MRIICLLGKSGTKKNLVKYTLEKLGYNRLTSYTTRNTKEGEVNGAEYHFVDKDSFFKLVEKHIIMEWAQFNGHFYGSPHPIGSINNVVVVEPGGYKSIKDVYGKQVTGVFISVTQSIQDKVAEKKRKNADQNVVVSLAARINTDDHKFKGIEKKVDLVVDGEQDVESIVAEILRYVAEKR